MSDPANVYALDDIRTITGREVEPIVATAADVTAAIRKYADVGGEVEQLASEASAAADDGIELDVPSAAVEDAPVVKLVHMLLTRAVNERASDVHIEPSEKDVRIRFRVDGVLHEVMRPPKNIQNGLISRLKVMADINIAERRVPQDGRVSLKVGSIGVDLRVATLPTVYGEKVVIRILNKESVLLRLDQIGFSDEAFKRYEQSFRKPYGAILVTGPTGSGKSTTLYATLNILNQPQTNIITVEDPVEYRLPGVNQVQVNNRAGMTFAAALRSILRADPDIILIGEIRDRETALIAVESALTGHLVLSTLHTNDAPSAIARLTEMGIEPYLTASAMDGVVAQRLARKLCDRCREPYEPTEAGADGGRIRAAPVPGHPRALPPGGLHGVLEDRLPRPDRHVRGYVGDRRDRKTHGGTLIVRSDPPGCTGAGNDPAPHRRAAEGCPRSHVHRGSLEGSGLNVRDDDNDESARPRHSARRTDPRAAGRGSHAERIGPAPHGGVAARHPACTGTSSGSSSIRCSRRRGSGPWSTRSFRSAGESSSSRTSSSTCRIPCPAGHDSA